MKMSKEGLAFLKEVEGFEQYPYKDVAGYLTIGVGHLLTKNELKSGLIRFGDEAVAWKNGISIQQVLDLLARDVEEFENVVNEKVVVALEQYQFDALVSFSFNVGVGSFKTSTLLRKLNNGSYKSVPFELSRWNRSGGKIVSGLANRRRAETNLWNGQY